MKLISLKLNSRGIDGWESPLLDFGQRTTSIYGPNGSGKTPLIQAVPFCFGFDAKFQHDIRDKCHSATLVFEHAGHLYRLSRDFGKFRIIFEKDDVRKEFFGEGDFSEAIFDELNIDVPSLVGKDRQATKPYLSSLLPIFYVRQTGGYDEPYRAPAQFIPDQFLEMVRFAFGLVPKRSYMIQRDIVAARDKLEDSQRKVVFQQKVLADLSARIDDSPETRNRLNERSKFLIAQLKELRESADVMGAASDALLEILCAKEERIRAIRRQCSELASRVAGISSIRSEIEGEIQTLSLNEESRRVFESFSDICGRANCGLFVSSSVSYARNLMYLKDQIKDLEANATRAEAQLAVLAARLSDEEAERASIAAKVDHRNGRAEISQVVLAVQSLTRELLETEQRLVAIAQLGEERRKYLQFDEERERSHKRIAALRNNGRKDLEFNSLRTKVQELTVKWMDTIGTPNASREVEIDSDFKFRFGKQTIDVFNGSTRSRIILAIHAALFELYLQVYDRPFRFLILDTPKQQELSSVDLANYISALECVCDKYNGQILISATEYRHIIGATDREWAPQFSGAEQLMFLGRPLS